MGRAEDIFQLLVDNGINAVNDFIRTKRVEELFLDYKRSADHGKGNSLNNRDRQTFSKAISGFGNSEGGVLLWGIECSRDDDLGDVPTKIMPVENPIRFRSWLESAASGLTVPSHSTVRHHAIESGDGTGVVATLIPKSDLVPHQTVKPLAYYMRAGSNFEPVPHSVLSGMFGRRPQPRVFQTYNFRPVGPFGNTGVRLIIEYNIRNDGPSIADDVFLTVNVESAPSEPSKILIKLENQTDFTMRNNFGIRTSLISNADVRLPPQSEMKSIILFINLVNPITAPLVVEGLVGATGAAPMHHRLEWHIDQLEQMVDDYLEGVRNGLNDEDLQDVVFRHIEE